MLRVRICGEVVVEAAGGPLPDAFLAGRQGRLVLAYLVCERHRSVPREELADLLWGDHLPASWTVSLAAIVSKLRRLFVEAGLDGVATVASAFGSYRLYLPEDAWVDWYTALAAVDSAESALLGGAYSVAVRYAAVAEAIAARGFLTDDSLWADAQRQALRELHVRAVLLAGEGYLLDGDASRAVEAGRHAVELDGLREAAYRLLMRAWAAAGERAEALRTWERCRTMVVDELGADPAPETEAVYLRVLTSELPDAVRQRIDRRTHNLPTFATTLIGRELERKALSSLLTQRRLVTVTGPGGVGKTRLAVELAQEGFDDTTAGVWFVDLLSAEAAIDVNTTLARALDVRSADATDDLAAVCDWLGGRRLCLIVDNCEHVIDAAASAVVTIMERCPAVTVVTTSRLPLDVPGEQLYRVSPLPTPPSHDTDPGSLAGYDAVRLFDDRARLGSPEFVVDDAIQAVATICRALDGLPLAIELAAARARTLGVAEIARRLDDRLAFLTSSRSSGRKGKDSLRDVIAWSYELLSDEDRRSFRSLGVFVDGFLLDAAAAVVGPGAAEAVSRLVDHSLVEFNDPERGRYRLLDSLRAFAIAELVDLGEWSNAARCHRDHFATLVEQGAAALAGPDQIAWLERVGAEHANVGAALSYCQDRGEGPALAALAVAMREFWEFAGRYADAERWFAVAKELLNEPDHHRARALAAGAATAHAVGDQDEARRRGQEALAMGERLGDDLVVSDACVTLARTTALHADFATALTLARRAIDAGERAGHWKAIIDAKRALRLVHAIAGHYEQAFAVDQEVIAAFATHHDTAGLATALANLGVSMIDSGRVPEARDYLTQALELHRQVGHRTAIAMCVANLGYVALVAGDLDQALAWNEEALVMAVDIGYAMCTTFVLNNLAETAAAMGDHRVAQRRYRECLSLTRRLGQIDRICLCIDGLGAIALTNGDPATAVRLLSAAAATRARHAITLLHRYEVANEHILTACRQQLAAARFDTEWSAGRSLDPCRCTMTV